MSGQMLLGVAVVLIVFTIAALLRGSRRRQSNLLLNMRRLFDSRTDADLVDFGSADSLPVSRVSGLIDGRAAEFSLWLPRDFPPEMPGWARWADGDTDDDRKPALGLRISCYSPVEFDAKKWGISPGPPFREVSLDPKFAVGEPVNFTTKSMEAFAFWKSRQGCRELACNLIQNSSALQITVRGADINVWWDVETLSNWSSFGPQLPAAVETLVELARVLDGRENLGHPGGRRCGRCAADLGRQDAYCCQCGAPWWQEEAVPGGRRARPHSAQ